MSTKDEALAEQRVEEYTRGRSLLEFKINEIILVYLYSCLLLVSHSFLLFYKQIVLGPVSVYIQSIITVLIHSLIFLNVLNTLHSIVSESITPIPRYRTYYYSYCNIYRIKKLADRV